MKKAAYRTRPVRRAPPKLSGAGAAIFERLAKKTKYADPQLAANWPSIAGADIAALCRPGRIAGMRTGRTLEIVVQTGAAAAQTQMRADEIVTRVNRYLGPNAIARIAVRQIASTAENNSRAGQKDDASPLGEALSSFRSAVQRRNSESD